MLAGVRLSTQKSPWNQIAEDKWCYAMLSCSAGVRLSAEKVIYTPVSYYHVETLTYWCILLAKMWMFIINSVHHSGSTCLRGFNNLWGKKTFPLHRIYCTCSDTWSGFAFKILLLVARWIKLQWDKVLVVMH